MRYRLDLPHYFPGDLYLEAGTIVGDDTPYLLPDGWEPSQHVTALDEGAEEVLAARDVKPDPLSEAALPNRIRPEDAMMQPDQKNPNKDQSPTNQTPAPDLTLPEASENISGSKPKK
jgi:hypothetical protein